MCVRKCVTLVDVGQGLGAAGAESGGVRLDRPRPSRGKCTTHHTPLYIVPFVLYMGRDLTTVYGHNMTKM